MMNIRPSVHSYILAIIVGYAKSDDCMASGDLDCSIRNQSLTLLPIIEHIERKCIPKVTRKTKKMRFSS